MAMLDIINAVHSDPLLTGYVSPNRGVIPIPGNLGSAGLRLRQAAPAIFWVPKSERFGPPMVKGQATTSTFAGPARSTRTRLATFAIHIQAELSPVGNIADFSTCEDLLNRFLIAMHRTLYGAYELSGGYFEDKDGTEILHDRRVYVLTDVTVQVPVYEPDTKTAPLNTFPVSAGISTTTNPPQ